MATTEKAESQKGYDSTSSGVIYYNKLTVEVNGEKIAKDYHSSTYAKHTIDVQAEDTVTVSAAYTLLAETNSCGRIRIAGTGSITITADIEEGTKRVFRDYQLGTGSIGGWEHSALRSYYYETLLPLIPENVRAHLKTVLKNHPARNTANKEFMQTTEEKVCMPSKSELFGDGDVNQPWYKTLFPDNPSRVKKKLGNTDASKWRLRTAFDYHYNYTVQSNGGFSNVGALSHDSSGVSLCFFT